MNPRSERRRILDKANDFMQTLESFLNTVHLQNGQLCFRIQWEHCQEPPHPTGTFWTIHPVLLFGWHLPKMRADPLLDYMTHRSKPIFGFSIHLIISNLNTYRQANKKLSPILSIYTTSLALHRYRDKVTKAKN